MDIENLLQHNKHGIMNLEEKKGILSYIKDKAEECLKGQNTYRDRMISELNTTETKLTVAILISSIPIILICA